MSLDMENLWSPEITSDFLSPRDILRCQAIALREHTDGLISAEMRFTKDSVEQTIHLALDILDPEGTRHRILTAHHSEERLFPCHVEAKSSSTAQIAYSDFEFQQLVRQILHSGEVKALVLSLIARVRESHPMERTPILRHHNGHKRLFRPAWIGVEAEAECYIAAMYDETQGVD